MTVSVERNLPVPDKQVHACRAALHDDQPQSDRSGLLKGLADALIASYDVSRSVTTLDEAINVYEEALQLRLVGHACRAESTSDLGGALWRFCYLHRPDTARSRRCIELFREAVLLRPSGHDLRDQSLHRLATALLFISFEHLQGGRDALTESVCLSREALQLRPLGHPDRGKTLNTLAIALWRCFEHYGDADALAESIAMHRDVMPLHPPGHPDRAMALSNLGTTLRRAFDHMGGADMLAEAIALHREALNLRPIGDPLRFNELDNLANSLWANVLHSGQSESLSEAIRLHREALNLLSEGHPERARLLASLADALLASVRDSSNSHSLDEAITLLREALLLQPIGNPLRPYSLNSLAEALQAKHDEHGDIDALKEAIILQREALDLHPKGHSRRLESLEKLAVLLQRSECQSWTEALELYREALEITPSGYPARARLLSGMSRCFLDTSSPSFNLPEGISHLARAYADDFSHIGQRLKSAVSDLRRVEEAYAATRETADAAAVMQLSDLVLHLYAEVIGLLPRAAHFGLDHDARLHAVSGSDEIARNAAARAIVLGRTAQAVEMLEEGRAIFWSQSLRLRDTGFDGVPEHNRQELDRLFRHLNHGARRLEISQQTASERERDLETRRQYNVEAEALISKIRGYPGLNRFLMPASFQALIAGLPDGIAVIVNASKLGYHALLLNRVTGQAASLELKAFDAHFDSAALRTQLPRDISVTTKESYGNDTRAMRLVHARQESSIENVLARLWTSIVQPIINQLGLQPATSRARPRLWWCVTGDLGFLPIHAAGKYQDPNGVCASDYVVSSYVPTLSSLTKARNDWRPVPRIELSGLLICEASSANNGPARYLPNAANEVRLVHERFELAQAEVLNTISDHTSLSELRSMLEGTSAHILHLACHGIQDPNPLKSALMLQDGRLTIKEIMQFSLPRAVLAFLSACQTAKGDKNAPDQAVHLAASMLFCGFRSIIGTMWLMHDEDGPKVADRLYEVLFKKDSLDLDDIPYALDDAVQVLRRGGVPASRWALFMHMGG